MKPFYGFCIVLWNTIAFFVHHTQYDLGICIALLGRLEI